MAKYTQKVTTRDLRGKALIEYKEKLKLNDVQRDIIVGSVLGDACITNTRNAQPYVNFGVQDLHPPQPPQPQSLRHPENNLKTSFAVVVHELYSKASQDKSKHKAEKLKYTHNLYKNFSDFAGAPPKVGVVQKGATKGREYIFFRTYRHACFKFYQDVFYSKTNKTERRIKRVPKIIHKLLTPRALAYWFMDNGATFGGNYYLGAHSFPLSDQKILQRALKANFGVNANIIKHKTYCKTYYRLCVTAESNQNFVDTISPYIIRGFKYRLNLKSKTNAADYTPTDYRPKVAKRELRGNALVEYKQKLELNNVQKEIIVGTTLGDASITNLNNSFPYIRFAQG